MTAISPGTMQLMNMGFGAVSSGLSGVAQWRAGSAEQQAYNQNADLELQKMEEERSASYQKYSQLSGRQRVLYAKAGVDPNSGSPLLTLLDTALEQEVADKRIQRAGRSRSDMLRYYGQTAASAARTTGLTTFLTGLGVSANQYYEYVKGA